MKRTVALVTAAVLICAAFSALFQAVRHSPFSAADEARVRTIKASLSEMQGENVRGGKIAGAAGKRGSAPAGCIVKFSPGAGLEEIYSCVSRYSYRLLADSGKRLFWIDVPSAADFTAAYPDIVESAEEDRCLTLSATVDDPLASSQWELDNLEAYAAWDVTTGDRSVTVAVLDSGIYRAHPDFENVAILAGYDAVERSEGVADDKNGHGTGITSIIAAAADNGIGMAGVAGNVTILPVRVSDGSGYIHSSDFIEAVYYAADAGADVINMSFGGYNYSTMEAVAIQYADKKGCVLVSAAGNQEANAQYTGMKAYPASYAGVISVGAIDSSGRICAFSQRNDDVDLVAPGEDVTVANLVDGYNRKSGTSFASAYVSAVAALCLSALDKGCTFSSDQFLSLISSVNSGEKAEGCGCGKINAKDAVTNVNRPLIAGAEDGGVYHKNISVTFNRGTARLDGRAFRSGESVITSGSHKLEVRDGKNVIVMNFITDNIPLKYDYALGQNGASVTFTRGKASMDGVPYLSGTPVTASGKHCFKLTGPYGNTERFDFECNFRAPEIFGVENGGNYTAPVRITASGGGALTLNGAVIPPDTIVSQSGSYSLISTAANGNDRTFTHFNVLLPSVRTYNSAVISPKLIADGEYRVLMLYNDTLSGVRVFSWDELSRTKYFIRTQSKVLGCAFSDKKAAFIHSDGISVCERAAISSGTVSNLLFRGFEKPASAAASFGSHVYYVCAALNGSQLWRMDIETGESSLLADFEGGADFLSADGTNIAAASSDGTIFAFDQNGTLLHKLSNCGRINSLVVNDGYLCTGSGVYDIDSKEKLFSTGSGERAVFAKNGVLVTDTAVYDLGKRCPAARFGEQLSDAVVADGGFAFKSLQGMKIEAINTENAELNAENAAVLLNAAPCSDLVFGSEEQLSVYESYVGTPDDWDVVSAAIPAGSGVIYAISASERLLCAIDCRTLAVRSRRRLRFVPSCVCGGDGAVYVSFSDENRIFVLRDDQSEGEYLRCGQSFTKIAFHGGKLYALNDKGDLYALSPSNPAAAETVIRSQNVIDFACCGSCIYAYLKPLALPMLYKIDTKGYSVEGAVQVAVNADRVFAAEDRVFLGKKAYNSRSLKLEYRTDDNVRTACKKYFITENGLYAANTGALLGDISVSSSLPLFDDSYNYYTFEKSRLCKITNVRANLHSLPEISGLTPNGTVRGPVSAVFPYGTGYLDGEPYASGDLIENGGVHEIVVALPFGVSTGFEFTIEATINAIFLAAEKPVISVNESTKLIVTARPHTYGVVSVRYSADNDCVLVHDDGSVIGAEEGTCVVTATTADGGHSAQIALTVTKGELKFDSSYFYADPSRRMVKGIPPGTSVETFFAAASETYGTVTINDYNGVEVSAGTIHTGMTAQLLNVREKVIDKWSLSVTGDLDCDGYITADDYYVLERAQSRSDSLSDAFTSSADLDGDGTVTSFDLLALKEYLLGSLSIGKPLTLPERTANTKFRLIMPQVLAPKINFSVGLTLTDTKNASSVSGVLRYDSSLLSLADVQICGAYRRGFHSAGEGSLYFFSDLSPAANTSVLLKAEFRVSEKAETGAKLSVSCCDIAVYDGTAATAEAASAEAVISPEPPTEVLIFNLPDYVFDAAVTENRCLFPPDTQDIHVSAYPMERCDVVGAASFGSGQTASFAVVVRDEDGTRQYNYECEREKGAVHTPVKTDVYKNGNANLCGLSVAGTELLPPFDRAVTDYYIVGVHPEALKISAEPENELASVRVFPYDSASGTVTVRCTAEDGSETAYVLHILSELSTLRSESAEKPSHLWLWLPSVLMLTISVTAATVLFIKNLKKAHEQET